MAIETATTAAVTGTSSDNARQFGAVFTSIIAVRVTFEEDSIDDTSASAAVYTVTGAAQGDFVLVSAVSSLGDDMQFTGQVTDANQVTVVVYNGAGAANTAAATVGNLNIIVLRVDPNLFLNAAAY